MKAMAGLYLLPKSAFNSVSNGKPSAVEYMAVQSLLLMAVKISSLRLLRKLQFSSMFAGKPTLATHALGK
jgi:hypothetical protein